MEMDSGLVVAELIGSFESAVDSELIERRVSLEEAC